MPEHFYTGPSSGHYPMGRDASGLLLGAVEPGDVRDLNEAPDPSWLPRAGNEELLAALLEAREEPAGELEDSDGSGEDAPAGELPQRTPRRKRPAAEDTATLPDTATAGDSGSEES